MNLGGNVVAHGEKPDRVPWRIGLQDPRDKEGVVGAVAVHDASAVTSGVYERCFERDGTFYHHILDPETGLPAQTDTAGATVIARRSLDAEGYSTTLLALGIERGIAFARSHPAPPARARAMRRAAAGPTGHRSGRVSPAWSGRRASRRCA